MHIHLLYAFNEHIELSLNDSGGFLTAEILLSDTVSPPGFSQRWAYVLPLFLIYYCFLYLLMILSYQLYSSPILTKFAGLLELWL